MRLLLGHHEHGRRAVVERARVAGRDGAVLRVEGRLELGELLHRRAGRGPSSRVTSPSADRHDLGVEVAGVARRDRAVLRGLGPLVLRLAADVAALGDVLRREPHRDVDVVRRAVGAVELRVRLERRLRGEARHGLDAGGDVLVALAGLDRVEGHPDRLQRGRAEAVDRRGGDVMVDARPAARRCGRRCSPARRPGSRSPS